MVLDSTVYITLEAKCLFDLISKVNKLQVELIDGTSLTTSLLVEDIKEILDGLVD